MNRRKTIVLCITGIIFLFLMQGLSDAYTFSTNSVGPLSTVKITDMSGSLSSSGSAITVNAWDANGNWLNQSGSAAPLMLYNHGTTSIAGTDLMSRFQGTPMTYSFIINSSMTVMTNVKRSEDGTLNFPITFTNGLNNFALNTVGPLSTVKITDMSGSLSSSGSAITVSAWDASGNTLTQSASATPLMLNNHGTTTIAGTDLMARFPTGTPMTYQFGVSSSQYIITNVKNSTDGTISVPIVFTSGITNYSTNSVGPRSTLKITDMSGSLSASGVAITVSAWDASGSVLPQSGSAAPLTLYNHGTTTITGTALAARFTGGIPAAYGITVGSSQYTIANVTASTDGSINIPTVFSSGTNNFTANSIDSGDTIKVSDLSGSLGSSGAAITVSAWDASGNALTQSGSASPLVLYSYGTTRITGSALAARFTGGIPAAYAFTVGSANYLITTVKSTAGGTLNIPNVVYNGSTGSLLMISLKTTSATFAQSDLTGTWNMMMFSAGPDVSSNMWWGWFRMNASIDQSGNTTINNSPYVPMSNLGALTLPNPLHVTSTIDSHGVITQSGSDAAGDFHGNMASNKNLMVGVQTNHQNSNNRTIFIAVRQNGTTFSSADISSVNFVYHNITSGYDNIWEYGSGSINSSQQVTLSSCSNSSGNCTLPASNFTTLSITSTGIVSSTADGPTFQGVMTPDKKTIFATQGNGTTKSINIMVLQITGQTFTQSDLAGVWNQNFIISNPTNPAWLYGTMSVDNSGVTNWSSQVVNGVSQSASSDTVSINSTGTITTSSNSSFNGTVSFNKDMCISTQSVNIQ